MSTPEAPQDNSLAVAQFQSQEAQKAKEQEKLDAEKKKQELAGLRTSSAGTAKNDTAAYLQSLGLNPEQYGSDIDRQIQSIISGINPADENPGSYFKTAPQDIYGNLTKSYQTKNQAALDPIFSPDFETKKIGMTMDDPYIANILGEQRGNADAIIQNMLKRGVITDTGAAGASSDLDRQASGVRTKLNTIGDTVLAGGQQKLKDVANQGRTTAGTLKLGQVFDPSTYSSNADQVFNDFVSSLGDQIKSNVSGNLFQTNGLAAIAGASQGAGNTKYNPRAAAGIIDPEDDTISKAVKSESIF